MMLFYSPVYLCVCNWPGCHCFSFHNS